MSIVGYLSSLAGGFGTTSTHTLPGGCSAGDYLLAVAAQNAGAYTCSDSFGSTVKSGPDSFGGAIRSYVFGKALTSGDVTAGSVTYTWTGSAKCVSAGVVLRNETIGTIDPPNMVNGSSASVPAVSGGSHTIVLVACRVLSGTHATITIPSPHTADTSGYAETGSGANTTAAIGVDTAATSGTVTTSPAADRVVVYAVAAATTGGANVPPTCNAGADVTTDAVETVTLTGTDADTDGTVTLREWLYSGSVVYTGNPYVFTAPASQTQQVRTYTYRVTDDSGATATDTVDVTIRAHPEWWYHSDAQWHGAKTVWL